jgi:chromosome segregation ATPase
MPKKNLEAKKIKAQMDKEYENLKSKVAPKMQKRARGKLNRLRKSMSRLKPLKVKEHSILMAKRDMMSKLSQVGKQISSAKKKSVTDKARMASAARELKRLRKEIPKLNRNVRAWSSAERRMARKHKSIDRNLGNLQKRIAREEKGKEKVVKALGKYFK